MSRRLICACLALLAVLLIACARGEQPPTAAPTPAKDFATLLEEAEADLDAKQAEAAAEKLRQALSLDEKSAKAYFLLGNAYAQQEEFADAEKQFLRALELDSAYTDARANLGVVYYQQGKLTDAESTFRAVLEQAPDDAELHYNLGGVLAGLGRFDEAIAEFRQSAALDPNLAEPYLGLGSVYERQGQKDQAITALKKYLELSRDPTWRQRAEQMLRTLEQ